MNDLRADCSRCFALCCVVPAFAKSVDFAIDKPARTPCPNLRDDFRCGIHTTLRDKGFTGCTVYDCFGAGQQVAQVTFGGTSWRDDPASAATMFSVFPVMRQLHELLWYLTEVLDLEPARAEHPAARDLKATIEALTTGTPDELLALDVGPHWERANALLLRASESVRGNATSGNDTTGKATSGKGNKGNKGKSGKGGKGKSGKGRNHRGADLIGKDLKGADLRASNLRGAYLIGADLKGADLRLVDFIGADLRGADLSGADLTGAFFLTQAQVDAAKGDRATKLPKSLTRPTHWR